MSRRIALALSSATLAVLGTVVGAGVATAAPAAGSSLQSPTGSACRTHNPPGGGSVTVCRTWTSDGQGAYNGTWKITRKTGAAVAARFAPIFAIFSWINASGKRRLRSPASLELITGLVKSSR